MIRRRMVLLLGLLLILAAVCLPALAENEKEPDEWTVMFYFCGSDLESKYAYASGNLKEIAEIRYPYNLTFLYTADKREDGSLILLQDKVNILVETGGCSAWHAQDLGMDIRTDALQRWSFRYFPETNGKLTEEDYYFGTGEQFLNSYELLDTLPLRSMSDPETLADFIRWGAREYPAKKYALVLWDHGGGAKSGLFIDELLGGEIMYLSKLKQALADGGVRLETLVLDACMMASIETAWNVKDYANWLVASEEVVPGKGTAAGGWLQALINDPGMDGKTLGRSICDTTAVKYANDTDQMAKSLLTWSVIDLSKVDRLMDAANSFFSLLNNAYMRYPDLAKVYASYLYKAEEYGDEMQNMRDFGSVICNTDMVHYFSPELLQSAVSALSETVNYISRGPGRSAARGISFCYPADASPEEMNIYAENFPMAVYLAYLDAISPWTAPDWVYDEMERLPQLEDIPELRIAFKKTTAESGMPGLAFGASIGNLNDVQYRLYRLDPKTGETVLLGWTDCGEEVTREAVIFRASDPMHWPSIDGELCCIEMVQNNDSLILYNIPVQIGSETAVLRCGREITYRDEGETRISEYQVYGAWEGYNEDSELMSRSVKPLSALAGQEYRLLYPKDGAAGGTDCTMSRAMILYRQLDVREIPLPAGTYYLEYEIMDMFMRKTVPERIEIYWDGKEMHFPKGIWNE